MNEVLERLIAELREHERRRFEAYAEWGRVKPGIMAGDPDAAIIGNIARTRARHHERAGDVALARIREHIAAEFNGSRP